MDIQRPRYWTEAKLTWTGDPSHLARWLTRAESPFRTLQMLLLGQTTLDVRQLSVLKKVESLCLNNCKLETGQAGNPWPLLASGSRSLKVVRLNNCTFKMPEPFLETSAPCLEVSAQPRNQPPTEPHNFLADLARSLFLLLVVLG